MQSDAAVFFWILALGTVSQESQILSLPSKIVITTQCAPVTESYYDSTNHPSTLNIFWLGHNETYVFCFLLLNGSTNPPLEWFDDPPQKGSVVGILVEASRPCNYQ